MNKILLLVIFTAGLTFFSFSGIAGEGHGSAIGTMASIMKHLNHHPSDAEKKDLQKIIHNHSSSANEKTLAQAMINLEHRVADGDKGMLSDLMHDAAATDNEKSLAKIILNLSHKPSSHDKELLKAMQ